MIRASALLTLHAVIAPAALAAEGGSEGGVMDFSLIQFISALVVFGVVLFILHRTAWPRILKGLAEREEKIRSEVFAAEDARKKAAEAQKAFERSLAEAKAEAARMIDATRAEQARLAADLREKAEAELGQLREQARNQIESAKRAALAEIAEQAGSLAVEVAAKVLRRQVNENDQRRLVEETIEQSARETAGV